MAENEQKKPSQEELKNLFVWNDPTTWASKAALEMAAYVVMVAGIVLLFSWPFLGGALVGLVFSLFFSDEILQIIRGISPTIEKEGMVKTLLLLGLLFAFFVSQPAIFLGGAIGLLLKNSTKNWNS